MKFILLLLVLTMPAVSFRANMWKGIAMLKGTSYSWGGESLRGADCSGAMYYLFKLAGKPIPRMTARKMYVVYGKQPTKNWKCLEEFDLVWWTISPTRQYGHVGLAEGDSNHHLWQAGVKSGFSRKQFIKGGYWDRYYSGSGGVDD